MNLPKPVFIGFFPKARPPRPDDLRPDHVSEICSVSHCINRAPDGWINHWTHNELGFFDTEDLARAVAAASPGDFEVFAYRLFPLVFDKGQQADFTVPVAPIEDVAGYESIGYDPVSRSTSPFFECSPLSCNSAAEEYAVNNMCLIDQVADAVKACKEICTGNYEPGPYYLFEVLRKRGCGRDIGSTSRLIQAIE